MLSELLLAFGKVVATKLSGAANVVLARTELLGGVTDKPEEAEERIYGQAGVYFRPDPPRTKAQATGVRREGHAETVGLRDGDQVVQVASDDLRLRAEVNPPEGSLGLVHYGGAFIDLRWNADKTGSVITIYTPRKNPDGSPAIATQISIDTAEDNDSVTVQHSSGANFTIMDGKIVQTAPDGTYAEVKSETITLAAAKVSIVGGAMLGAADPASGQGVMLSTEMLAWVTQVNGALVTIAGAAGGVVPVITVPTAVPAASTKVKAAP